MIFKNKRWNQLASLRRFTELKPSHIKQETAKKHEKYEINQYTNGCEPFHRTNAMFGIVTCMTSIF